MDGEEIFSIRLVLQKNPAHSRAGSTLKAVKSLASKGAANSPEFRCHPSKEVHQTQPFFEELIAFLRLDIIMLNGFKATLCRPSRE